MPFPPYSTWLRSSRRKAAKRCPGAPRKPTAAERRKLQIVQLSRAMRATDAEKVILLSQCSTPGPAVARANSAMQGEADETANVVPSASLVELWQSTVLDALSVEDRATYQTLLDLRKAKEARLEQEARAFFLRRSFVGGSRNLCQHAIAVAPNGDLSE